MLLGIDGGDHYGTSTANMLAGVYASASAAPSTSRPRNGTHSFRVTSPVAPFENRRVLPSVRNTIGWGAAMYFGALPASSNAYALLHWRNNAAGTVHYFAISTTGQVEIRNSAGTILAASDPVLTAGEYQHLEFKSVVNGASGAVEVRRNGVTVLNASGINIGSTDTVAQWGWGQIGLGNNGIVEWCVDDIFWWDDVGSQNNDFLGDRVVHFLKPNADQAASDWVRNTGSNDFEAIDDLVQDGDTTYIEAATAGDISEFGLEDLPGDVSAVSGIMVYNFAKKTDSGLGSIRQSLLSADVGSPASPAVALGDEHAIGESYGYHMDVYETDPATGALWLPAAVNAARLRLERTA